MSQFEVADNKVTERARRYVSGIHRGRCQDRRLSAVS